MRPRFFVILIACMFIGGSAVLTVIAQDETENQTQPSEVVVEKMTVNASSPSDEIFSILKYSYLDYIQKNKKDQTFDITIKSQSEDKTVESFINQDVTNIAVSRLLTKNEVEKFVSKNSKTPKVVSAFKTPIVVVVHKTNTIQQYDYATLKKIFTGAVTSWKELDEEAVDDQIELLIPPEDSAATKMFKETVLGGADFATDNLKIEDEKTLSDHLKLAGGRITFMSNCYVGDNPRVQRATLLNKSGKTFVLNENNVRNDTYPLIAKTYFYYTEEIPEAFNQLIDYAKENPVGLNSYRIFRIVAID